MTWEWVVLILGLVWSLVGFAATAAWSSTYEKNEDDDCIYKEDDTLPRRMF